MYQERFYREQISSKFKLEVAYKESDLLILSDAQLDEGTTRDILVKHYETVEGYLKKTPLFFKSLSPLADDDSAPPIVREMIAAARLSGIGPFSAVAGAIATYVGRDLLKFSREIIVENGGDIFLRINSDKSLGVYLGDDYQPSVIKLKLSKRDQPFGIASSSATIGPSLNFGNADLVSVISKDAIAVDSFATAFSNQIKTLADSRLVIESAKANPAIEGILVAFSGKIFLWGDLELAE
ncbi:MAG: UPF0280 family protein [Candidatus Omnitrophica bacterium]|nr:UPF0280 family protein [Candidatus Omnitrophota bacterium]MBU2044243.1 UPF0280 family protein [Candidatus Omnitrophota bacterium]MBU2473440.1 UPF0280 family protein [Candidatus Omnitrophota bacterium]